MCVMDGRSYQEGKMINRVFTNKFQEVISNYIYDMMTLKSYVNTISPKLIQDRKEFTTSPHNVTTMIKVIHLASQLPNEEKNDGLKTSTNKMKEWLLRECQFQIDNDMKKFSYSYSKDTPLGRKISEETEKLNDFEGKINILYNTCFVNLVTYFEQLISKLLYERFKIYPNAAGLNEKKITFGQVEVFCTIEDLKETLIQEELENIMRGNFQSWLKYITDKLSCDLSWVNSNESEIVKIFQIRNILVHNGGIINEIFLRNTNLTGCRDSMLGEMYKIDNKIFNEAYDLLYKAGIIIAYGCWHALEKNSDSANLRGDIFINEIGIELLNSKDGKFGAYFFEYIGKDKYFDKYSKQICVINKYLSLRYTPEWPKYKDELILQDHSDKNDLIKMCYSILIDDFDKAFSLLEKIFGDEITTETIKTCPIFKILENDSRMEKYLPEITIPEKLEEDVANIDNLIVNSGINKIEASTTENCEICVSTPDSISSYKKRTVKLMKLITQRSRYSKGYKYSIHGRARTWNDFRNANEKQI